MSELSMNRRAMSQQPVPADPQATPPLQRAVQTMAQLKVDALLIGPGADLAVLTGYRAHPSERMTLLVVRADGAHRLIVPELERAVAVAGMTQTPLPAALPITSYGETDDPADAAVAALDGICGNSASQAPSISVGDQLWSRFLIGIQSRLTVGRALPPRWGVASAVTRQVRMTKDASALEGLRRAGAAIDAVHSQMAQMLRAGRTEREVGHDIAARMRIAGHDDVDFVIVGSGPNGASPHHATSDRVIQEGDAVVVDIGGPVNGWFSDCTRNYCVGHEPAGYREVFDVLRQAQQAAVAHVRPGVTAASVDAAARGVIAAAGFGDAFIHRTGHGIGLEVHEEPYIAPGNTLRLEPGMTFSIEPGIYLPGRFGMRIEDIVAVTATGVERMNTTSIDVVTVPA